MTIASTANLVPSLLSGSVDVTIAGISHVTPAILKGEPIRFFCGLAANKGAQLLVKSSSNFKSVQDLGTWQEVLKQLAGKKVGVPAIGVEDHQRLAASIKEAGVNPSSVSFVAVGVGATSTAALQNNQVDVLMAYPFDDAHLLTPGTGRLILLLAPPIGPTLFQNNWSLGMAARSDWITNHRQTAKAFCDAMAAGMNAISDPKSDAALSSLLSTNGNLSQTELPIAKQDLKIYGFSTALPRDQIEASAKVLAGYNIIASPITYDSLVLKP